MFVSKAMVSCQMLSELEEVIQYKLVPERRDIIRETWWERLQVLNAQKNTHTHSLKEFKSSFTCAVQACDVKQMLLLMENIPSAGMWRLSSVSDLSIVALSVSSLMCFQILFL